MGFWLKTRRVGDVVVLDLSGRLMVGEPVLLLQHTVRRFIEEGVLTYRLNLGGLSHIDSGGFAELLATSSSIRHTGGDVKLVNVEESPTTFLQTRKLLEVFET